MDLNFCPHCGYDLSKAEQITVGDLTWDPEGNMTYRGHTIVLATTPHMIVGALIRAKGKIVRSETMLSVIDTFTSNVPNVHVHGIRREFLKFDSKFDRLETVWGRGYRWRQPDERVTPTKWNQFK